MPNEALEKAFAPFVGQEFGPPETGRDAVNEPMIRQWCDAMGDTSPVYLDPDAARRSTHAGIVAPPAMLQAWILPGFRMSDPDRPPRDRQEELHALFQEHGYSGVLATDCDLEFERYLRPGESVTAHAVIESISEEKATAVGIGYFIVTRTTFSANGENVGSMVFRVLRFKPSQRPKAPASEAPGVPLRIRPPRGHDNGWWWDAIDRGELTIQKCSDCGALRHPPRPMCPHCQSTSWDAQPARGHGTVHSYTVMHHPQIPGYGFPLAVGLIDLEEGTRLVANIVDCEFDEIHIGMKVEASIEEVDAGGLKLPVFRPVK
jgi:uncharacterized OB-fold protein/acyl dehydratase